ncbi:tetratricopeptide repeat protein [candidate division KSB1 bacterium]|nr:tetratricopeptide repeat protein [candidate division KSB1 bacterium]
MQSRFINLCIQKIKKFPFVATILLITIVTLIGYANSFNCSFHFDDIGDIVENAAIRDIHNVDLWWHYAKNRPIAMFTFVLNYHFHKLDVVGYHIVNFLIHLFNAWLVAWLFLLTLKTPTMRDHRISRYQYQLAAFAGLLFAVHPIQTQGVTYIIQRMASLATLFYLASLACYISARLQPTNKLKNITLFITATGCAILGMLTKQITFTLPFAVILYEFTFFHSTIRKAYEANKRLYGSLALVSIMLLLIIPLTGNLKFNVLFRTIVPQQGHTYSITGLEYLLTQFNVIVTYIRLLFIPVHQMVDYNYPIAHSFFSFPTWFNFSILIAIIIPAIKLLRSQRLIAFGIFWFFLTLSIESSIIPIPNVIFEHRVYLPFVGFAFIIATIAGTIADRIKPTYIQAGAIVLIVLFSGLTILRNQVWKTDEILWGDVIKKSPTNARAWNNRGTYRVAQHNYEGALADFDQAISVNPFFYAAVNNKGSVYLKQEKYEQALQQFNIALEMSHTYVQAFNNRGLVYLNWKQYEQALSNFDQALFNNPNFTQSFNNRGITLMALNQYDKAEKDFKRLLSLDPDFIDALNNLGVLYRDQKNYDHAIYYFSLAVKKQPSFVRAWVNRGITYQYQHEYKKAIADYTTALQYDPNHIDALFNRGLIHIEQHKYTDAIADFTKLTTLYPDTLSAWFSRGVAFKELKKYDNALSDFNHVLTVEPENVEALTYRGVVQFELKQLNEALKDFENAIRHSPDYAPAFENRGYFYAQTGNYERAIHDFNRAIELDSSYVDAYNNRGNTYSILKKFALAIHDYTMALKLDPSYLNARYNRAVCYYQNKQYQPAVEDLKICQAAGIQINPKFAQALKSKLNYETEISKTNLH